MILPDLITKFRKIYPEVTFEIWEAEGARIIELLDNRLIEIAITRTQDDNLTYELLILSNEPFLIAMSSENVCGANDETIKLAELKDQPLIIPLRWKTNFIEACLERDFEPNIVCVSDSIVQDLLMVKNNLGVAMIPLSGKRLFSDSDLIYKRIVEPEVTTHTVLAWRKNQTLSTACKNFIELFKEVFIKEANSVEKGD